VSPAKSKCTAGVDYKNTTPIIRRHQVIFHDNECIPDSYFRKGGGQAGQNVGRVLALDKTTEVTPVLTSARRHSAAHKKEIRKIEDEIYSLSQEMANLTMGRGFLLTPKKKKETALIPERTIARIPSSDSEYTDSELSETGSFESSCSSSGIYDKNDKDDLECSLKFNHDDGKVSADDKYSPERSSGNFYYTVLDPNSGTVQNVRRSSRNSFGSPAGKKSFGSPPVGRESFGSPPAGKKSYGSPPVGRKSFGSPAGKKTSGSPPVGKKSFGSFAAGKKSFRSPPSGKKSFGSPPSGKKSFGSPAGKK